MSLKDYFESLTGAAPACHRLDNILLLMTGAVFAGYTVAHFPPKFLEHFKKWYIQFIIFMIIGLSTVTNKKKYFYYIIGDAILMTGLIQLLEYIVKKSYPKKEREEDTKRS